MERAMARDNINPNDRQLACARIGSPEGQDYLVRTAHLARNQVLHLVVTSVYDLSQAGMACAANYAWVNRSSMTFLCRQVRP